MTLTLVVLVQVEEALSDFDTPALDIIHAAEHQRGYEDLLVVRLLPEVDIRQAMLAAIAQAATPLVAMPFNMGDPLPPEALTDWWDWWQPSAEAGATTALTAQVFGGEKAALRWSVQHLDRV